MNVMKMPELTNYGNYASGNYGAHTQLVTVGPISVWFSYSTPVAFMVDGHKRVISANVWSRTTGKHLNMIDPDKSKRVPNEEFDRLWKEQVEPLFQGVAA